jgi:hypothetical protein
LAFVEQQTFGGSEVIAIVARFQCDEAERGERAGDQGLRVGQLPGDFGCLAGVESGLSELATSPFDIGAYT